MRTLRAWLLRVAGLFGKERREQQLAEEMDSHLQMHVDDNLRSGMSPVEARRAALVKLGGVEATKQIYRERRGLPVLETLLQDVRYAARTLRKNPGFTITALLSLAVGIGANGAIFTAANAVLWRTLPVADPRSLVRLTTIREDHTEFTYLPATFAEELRRNSGVFSDVISETSDGLSFSADGDRAERVVGEVDSPNLFTFLGVQPILGRGFSDEVQKGRWAPEVVLSYRFWQRRFGGDPQVLGKTIRLNNYPFTIVGVSPVSYYSLDLGFDPELRVPKMPFGQKLDPMELVSLYGGELMARLKPGVSLAQAEAATDASFQQFLHDHPDQQRRSNPMRHVRVLPGDKGWQEDLAQFRKPLIALLGLAGLVLLIACTNLASMLLARAMAQRREMAVRAAIGAGRARLVRQMLTESLLLSTAGGLFGLAVAAWAGRILFGFLPQQHIHIALDLAPDMRTAWFIAGLALLAAVLFGLIPTLQATRGDLTVSLKSDSAGSLGDTSGTSFRRFLVIGQVGLSLLLLVMAGLFERMLGHLRGGESFPQSDRVLLFTMKPQHELYDPERIRTLTNEVVRRVSELRGVRSAALAENGPLGSRRDRVTVEASSGQSIDVAADEVSPGYFETIGVPLIGGRDFSVQDKHGSPVVIVNDVFARQLFKDEDPLGQKITIRSEDHPAPLEIVGIVRASRYYDLHAPPPPAVYTDIQQDTPYMPTLHVRVAGTSAAPVIAEIRREFDSLDKDFPVFNIQRLEDRVNDSLARERLVSQLAGTFGGLALVLAVVGLYGIVAYSVTRRGREIGIRMALGATPGEMLAMVLRECMVLALSGIALGVPVTLVAARLISTQLLGISTADPPLIVVAAATLMLTAAALAGFLPAHKASRVDPMIALRHE
jgi:predicted permease